MQIARLPTRAVGALVAAIIIVSALPAEAAPSTTLCKGFRDCVEEGRSHAGYAPVHRQSFWSMRSGHNCTNYIGYRMTHGRLAARPPGADDAGTWGSAAKKAGIPVGKRPTVGSVAYWKPNHHGASAGGHVAYVEAVRSNGSIVISEDHLGGTFMWRVLRKSSSAWPSGFIRFPESDGSPEGAFHWLRPDGVGRIRLSATSGDPDAPAGARRYLVTVGGPRGAAGVETFTFRTRHFRFERLKTLSTRGTTTVHLYALNTPGTEGSDALIGSRRVTIR